MKWIRFFPLLFLATLLAQTKVYAQTHVNTWFRLSVQANLSEKVRGDLELQHRRQNIPDHDYPLRAGLMYAVRPWILYQWSKGVELGFSPLAWFRHNSIIINAADVYNKPKQEYRTTLGITIREQPFDKLVLFERNALEYRMFVDAPDVLRVRLKPGLQCRLPNHLSITLYDEVLLNVLGVTTAHIYDHNRIAGSLGCQCSKQVYVEAGYVRISRLPASNAALLQESNLVLNASYRIR